LLSQRARPVVLDVSGPGGPASTCGEPLLDRADLDAGELGVDEELERVEVLTW
jgi:hypothetical protein